MLVIGIAFNTLFQLTRSREFACQDLHIVTLLAAKLIGQILYKKNNFLKFLDIQLSGWLGYSVGSPDHLS